jgi:hypothetical protein
MVFTPASSLFEGAEAYDSEYAHSLLDIGGDTNIEPIVSTELLALLPSEPSEGQPVHSYATDAPDFDAGSLLALFEQEAGRKSSQGTKRKSSDYRGDLPLGGVRSRDTNIEPIVSTDDTPPNVITMPPPARPPPKRPLRCSHNNLMASSCVGCARSKSIVRV